MIRSIITDFDGTLVDTFEANLRAYQKAFQEVGLDLSAEKYRQCFGYRFDRFMIAMAIYDDNTAALIKEAKKNYYPFFFQYLKPNKSLLALIEGFHSMGGKTAIASTARKDNLMNAVRFLGIEDMFDVIYAGTDVKQGKPSPEIYLKAMDALDARAEQTIIFEDSAVGVEAAKASGAHFMVVSPDQFE